MNSDNTQTGDSDGAAREPIRIGSDSLDTFLDVLADRRRRSVLESLWGHSDDSISLTELLERMTSAEERNREGEEAVTHRELRIDLHHRQLPELSAAGVIDYDSRTRTIRVRNAEEVEEVMALYERIRELERR